MLAFLFTDYSVFGRVLNYHVSVYICGSIKEQSETSQRQLTQIRSNQFIYTTTFTILPGTTITFLGCFPASHFAASLAFKAASSTSCIVASLLTTIS